MQNILVPVDFSETSGNAAEYAAAFAQNFGAKLLFFHAYMLPTPVSEQPYVMVTADEMQKENEAQLEAMATKFREQYQLEVTTLARIGIPSDEIKDLVEELPIDLVVMGMKGAGGIDKIIGSTTVNVIRKIRTAVLVVPHDARYRKISGITYASNFSYQTSSRLFDPLMDIARKFAAPIYIFHVYTKGVEETPEILAGKKTLELVIGKHEHHYQMVEDDSIREGISHYLKHNNRDLLVMVAHKHGFFDRIFSTDHTAAMAYETHVPMLVLQDKP